MQNVYIGLGSNLGCREKNVRRAVALLDASENFSALETSPLYETQPIGFGSQPWFLNAALKAETGLEPRSLFQLCKRIERRLGRKPSSRNIPRIIDLDLLLFGDCILEEGNLVLPHPKLHTRRFVLEPLAALDESITHPVLNLSVSKLLSNMKESKKVIQLARKKPY